MSYITVARGDTEPHEVLFRDRKLGNLVDDDRYSASGTLPVASIVTPSGASNTPTLGAVVRISQGYYKVNVTALTNTTLSSTLSSGSWILRYTLRINGEDKSFDYPFFVVPSGDSEAGSAFYNSLDDFRRVIAERFESITDTAVASNGTLTLPFSSVRVISVKKNGATLIEGTDWTFRRPMYLKLVAGMTSTDQLDVRMATNFEDEEIRLIATEVKNAIDTRLATSFDLPFDEVPPRIKDIERAWVRGRIILEFGPRPGVSLNEDERKMAFNWVRGAKEELQGIADGSIPLLLADGTVLTPLNDFEDLHIDVQIDATDS